jgi:hypothetical protein
MKQIPNSLVQYSFFLTALVLAGFGANSLTRSSPTPDMESIYKVYAVLMLGDALAMFLCGLFLNKKIPVVFWFAVTIVSLNIILTICDQFGLVDLLFVILNTSTLGLLVNLRKEFLPQ